MSNDALAQDVLAAARPEPLPDGASLLVLDGAHEAELAALHGVKTADIQRAALAQDIWPRRYLRNRGTLDNAAQIRLLDARVALVGLGGLGGHLLEGLVRMGVGFIRAADGDVFEEHNLNRQLLCAASWLDKPKAEAATARATELNKAVELDARHAFLDAQSLPAFLDGCTVAVDALGGLADRLMLQRAAAGANIPLVTGAMAGTTGYVAVVRPGAPGPADFLGHGAAAEDVLGTPAQSVSLVAALMLKETLGLLDGGTSDLEGGMLLIDLAAMSFERVSLD